MLAEHRSSAAVSSPMLDTEAGVIFYWLVAIGLAPPDARPNFVMGDRCAHGDVS